MTYVPNLRSRAIAAAVALALLTAAGAALAAFNLRIPICAGGACAGGGGGGGSQSQLAVTIGDGEGEIRVTNGTAPYSYTLQITESLNQDTGTWESCVASPVAAEGTVATCGVSGGGMEFGTFLDEGTLWLSFYPVPFGGGMGYRYRLTVTDSAGHTATSNVSENVYPLI